MCLPTWWAVRVMETSADLALLLAVVSSLRNRPLPGTGWSLARWAYLEKFAR